MVEVMKKDEGVVNEKEPDYVETDKETMVTESKLEEKKEENEKSLDKNAGIGPNTQRELVEPWSQDTNSVSLISAENQVTSSLPGNPKHKSTPINSSDITVSRKLMEDQSSQGRSNYGSQQCEKNTTLIEDEEEPTSPVIKRNKKHEFHYPSQLKTKDTSPQNASIEKEEASAKTENLPFVESWNENSQFNLSPPNLLDTEYDQPEDRQKPKKKVRLDQQELTQKKVLDDLGISDEQFLKYQMELTKIQRNDDNLSVKAYKSLTLKTQLFKEPWVMDERTPADDECFFHAIIQQAQREEVNSSIPSSSFKDLLKEGNSLKLRQYIVSQMQFNNENEDLVKYRNNYAVLQVSTTDDKYPMMTWEQLCKKMLKRREWGDENVVQATAFLFGMDIVVTSLDSFPQRPNIFSKNADSVASTSGIELDGPFLILGKICSFENIGRFIIKALKRSFYSSN